MENRSNSHAIFLVAFLISAFKTLAIFNLVPFIAFAIWANRATSPTLLH